MPGARYLLAARLVLAGELAHDGRDDLGGNPDRAAADPATAARTIVGLTCELGTRILAAPCGDRVPCARPDDGSSDGAYHLLLACARIHGEVGGAALALVRLSAMPASARRTAVASSSAAAPAGAGSRKGECAVPIAARCRARADLALQMKRGDGDDRRHRPAGGVGPNGRCGRKASLLCCRGQAAGQVNHGPSIHASGPRPAGAAS